MTPEQATDILRSSLYVTLQVGSPFLILALVIGFVISLFQSVTQINEPTLSFVPKVLLVTLLLSLLFPWMLRTLTDYTLYLLQTQWDSLNLLE